MIRHRTDATQGASTATEFSDTTIALMSLHLPNMQTQGSGCGLRILAPPRAASQQRSDIFSAFAIHLP